MTSESRKAIRPSSSKWSKREMLSHHISMLKRVTIFKTWKLPLFLDLKSPLAGSTLSNWEMMRIPSRSLVWTDSTTMTSLTQSINLSRLTTSRRLTPLISLGIWSKWILPKIQVTHRSRAFKSGGLSMITWRSMICLTMSFQTSPTSNSGGKLKMPWTPEFQTAKSSETSTSLR